jgi:glutathione S-transferase
MKLYSAPLSLFAWKVEIALLEKGLAYDKVEVPFSQSAGYHPKHPDVLTANPKEQVPVLIDGALSLYDSTVILEYLEDAYPSPALYPAEPALRARCRLMEIHAGEVMLAPLRALMHRTGPRPAEPEIWLVQEAKAADAKILLAAQLSELDRDLADKPYVCGAFSIADIALFMTVLYVQRLGGPALSGTTALARWLERLLARPAFAAAAAAIAAADRALSQPVAGAYGASR